MIPIIEERADCWLTAAHRAAEPVAVTVVIPNYCAAGTLNRAVESARRQTIASIEIIVVDDASTDDSWDIISRQVANEPRLRAVRNKQNRGKSVGMNLGISLARGRWVAVLDADDWYHPERLTALMEVAERHRVDMVADNQFFYDAAADRIVGTAWSAGDGEWEMTLDGFIDGADAYAAFDVGMLKPIVRTDFARRPALAYDEAARDGHDFFHLLQFYAEGGRSAIADTPYYFYTQPFGALSHRWSHAGRKRYDFEAVSAVAQRQTAMAHARLTPRQAARLARRGEQLETLECFHQAKQRLAEHDYLAVAELVVRRPATLGFAARRLRQRLSAAPDPTPLERIAQRLRGRRRRPF
jgi:succinoglycan biosynthesis protein ExoO